MADLAGKTLGKYRIVAQLGRGGMGEVYKAYQPGLDRFVAIKVLPGRMAVEADFIARFEHEASAVARLRHPNIVLVFDFDVEDSLYYMVMEFIEGPTLEAELKRRGLEGQILTLDETVSIFSALASAVQYAHSRGMVHRDLKPGNIMFTAEGQVVLTDFGLARIVGEARLTLEGTVSGTPTYMSPEQGQGELGDERSDIYSLGVILYEMVTGRVPFEADTPLGVIMKHIQEPLPPPTTINSNLPQAIEQVILKATSKNPDDRYQTARDMAKALREALGVTTDQVQAAMPITTIVLTAPAGEAIATPILERAPTALPPSPYRGLFAFREQDAPFFFGREDFTDQLVEAVQHKSLVAMIGPSGSGKSSVVFAGLLPRLRQGEALRQAQHKAWAIADFRPGSRPFHALAAALLPLLEAHISEVDRLAETHKLAEALKKGDFGLDAVVGRILQKRPDASRLLLMVDQFEELYALCPEPEVRRRFLEVLLEAIQMPDDSGWRKDQAGSSFIPHPSSLVLVLTLRADFMGQALAHRPLADALQAASLILGPMTRPELERAIENPARKQGVVFEAGLVGRLLDDVGDEPGNLPLLEFALTSLWEQAEDRQLSHAGYEAIGRVDGALARYADEVFDRLDPAEQDRSRRVFVQMVRPGETTEDTRRLATRAELGESDWALAQRLADARLVVTDRDPAGQDIAEVVHEALIRNWGRLRAWMDADRTFRAWQERLRAALRQWEASRRDEGALLRGAPLAEAEVRLAERAADLGQTESEFIRAGVALREREAAEREAQAQALAEEHRRAEEEASARRRTRRFTGALLVLLVLAVAATGFALNQQGMAQLAEAEAARERDAALDARATAETAREAAAQAEAQVREQLVVADSQRLAFAAENQLRDESGAALLVAYEAVARHHNLVTEQALRDALEQVPWSMTILSAHTQRLTSAAFSPDGQRALTASADGTARLWDLAGQSLVIFEGHDDVVTSAAFSPDGERILTTSADNTARLWDLTGQSLVTFTGHTDRVGSAVFSPDGQRILTASDDGTARLWDLAGESLVIFEGHADALTSATLSPDGERILTASTDGTARLWDLEGTSLITFTGHAEEVTIARFSPDGQRILTASDDATARLWDLEGTSLITFTGHTERVGSVAFSPDGQLVVTASTDRTARLWDLEGTPLAILRGHGRGVRGAAFSPDGERILTVSADGTARLWDLTGQVRVTFSGHTNIVRSAAFSPDQRRILTASDDSTARVYELIGPPLPDLSGHAGPVPSAVFSPDGQRILTASRDHTARLWDLEGTSLVTFAGHTGEVTSAAFSPDGQRALTKSEDGTARLWDLTGQSLITFTGHEDEPTSAGFSPDGQRILTASGDGTARLWDLTGQLLVIFEGHAEAVASAVFSPDGQRVLTASEDGTARLWDLTGQPLVTFTGHTDRVWSAVFSPDGQRILTASRDGTARLWDLTGQSLAAFSGHSHEVEGAVFSPDGQRVLTRSRDHTARLWDLTGQLLVTFSGHTDELSVAVFSADGERVLTASNDGTARLWDLTGQLLVTFRGHTDVVRSAVFSPDGQRILTSSVDMTARQYLVNVEDVLAVAACRIGRGLSDEEITRFNIGTPRFVFEQRQCPPVFSWQK